MRVAAQFSRSCFRGPINSVDCDSRDRRWVLGVTESGHYFLYDTLALKPKWCHNVGSMALLTCGCFAPHDPSKFVTTSYDQYLRMYDTSSPKKTFRDPLDCGHSIHGCAFNTEEPILAAALDSGSVRIVDIRERVNLIQVETGHTSTISAVTWLPRSKNTVIAGDRRGRVFVFDIRSSQKPYELGRNRTSIDAEDAEDATHAHQFAVVALEFDDLGTNLYSLDNRGVLRQWDISQGLSTGRETRLRGNGERRRMARMCFFDGDLLAPSENFVVKVKSGENLPGHIRDVTWLAATNEGFVSAGADSYICVWRREHEMPAVADESDWTD